ncbi:MAG: tRNA (5-methylaminomethyl-2-thiouridine)(34)-methyltransferase MnmD [Gammaproteobacteria bacterium]|nr:tRNA (5-methylaminomethyl-2-thiouridine)(34)-methyltransferase MnmD [Gammaproteobacteria bacterium]MBT4493607.1 tRNA (5-methylaminomethyl-2-thiouridine)(34)-methyltransferase MnmD [Gammaproteobacteria bacterium]
MNDTYLLKPADIDWQEGAPHSQTFDDIYWNRDGAIEEKQHVFVEPLLELVGKDSRHTQVTVCELGFGFGINCLLTADAWLQKPTDCRLNLISFEKHPVDPITLSRQLSSFNLKFTDALLDQYPPPIRGQHVIWLAENIRLLLIFDDVETGLANLDASVDFWYLDGFSPAKNESMWQPQLFRKMFARSQPGARIATYSAAGHVRRALSTAGFDTEKRSGFSHKREMLTGKRPGDWQANDHGHTSIAIIGAGLAGLYCAEALNKRGLPFTLIDSGEPGASAIPQLAVLPHLAVRPEIRYRFSLTACQYMQTSPGFHGSGLVWRGRTQEEAERLQKISKLFPDELVETQVNGLTVFSQAGWLSYEKLKDGLSSRITTDTITTFNRKEEKWQASGKCSYTADNLILATGFSRSLLEPELQVRAIHGQAVTVPTRDIRRIVNSHVTIFPTDNGTSVVSGTYARRDDLAVDSEDTRYLVNTAKKMVELEGKEVMPYTGIRAVSRDRLPIVGELPVWDDLAGVNRVSAISSFNRGLYVMAAFGSRGATHARLCAEHVISKILGEPTALDLKQQVMLSPARFFIRDSKLQSS